MSRKTRESIILQGSILAFAGIISKIIGFLYRIPMANIMGNDGNGLYSVAFGIYNVALTLSSYSMPLAVSKLMSARIAEGRYKDAHRLFTRAVIFATLTGMIAACAMFFESKGLAVVYRRPGLERPVRVLAPTVFVVAILGTFRGYFQGHKNMVPTALSQVIEQIVNAVVSVVAAYGFVHAFEGEKDTASYGAMGGTLGTLTGAYAALLLFVGLFVIRKKSISAEMKKDDEITEDNGLIYKCIIMTVIPVIISQTIYQFGYTLDDLMYGNIMHARGVNDYEATCMQGIFNTQYNQLINLPVAVATAMASAMLPSIVAHFTVGEMETVKRKIGLVFRINMMISIPSFIGLTVLADPIMSVLFPGLKEYHNLAVALLSFGAIAIVFYSLSALSTSVLQGCDRMSIPVVHSGISLAIHAVIVGCLLAFTNLGVYALIIGNVTFPLVVCKLNLTTIRNLIGFMPDYHKVLTIPFVSAAIMGPAAYFTYHGLMHLFGSGAKIYMILSLIGAIIAGAGVYVIMLILFKAFTKKELKMIPIVRKLVK